MNTDTSLANSKNIRRDKVLVCALAHLDKCPRPLRVVKLLCPTCDVYFSGYSSTIKDVNFVPIRRRSNILVKLYRLFLKTLRIHRPIERITFKMDIASLHGHSFDVIVCHDIQLMPYLNSISANARIILDLREFYPKQFDHKISWRYLERPFYHYLCKNYLHEASACMTVSAGLSDAYSQEYSVKPKVIHSYAPASNLPPNLATDRQLKLLYHGGAIEARGIHQLIHAMDNINREAHLDLMLVGSGPYFDHLITLVEQRNNVSIIPAVDYSEIVKTTNQYDLGLIFYPPSTFNVDNCMPNKLFEMIQAKVPVLVSPLTSLKLFVKEHNIGWVAADFGPHALAETINHLTLDEINRVKSNMSSIAEIMSQEYANKDLLALILPNIEVANT